MKEAISVIKMRLHYLPTIIILAWLAWSGSITAQASEQSFRKDQCTVTINEFMPAKQRVLTDEDGDYEDWIELYNCSDEAIDLTGWYLSDRQDRPLQWQFPSVSIPAQGYLLVWASGKDRVDGKELHTNFRINAAGEPLLLSNAAGELIDEIPPIEAHAHEVVGRSPDGVGEVMILAEPTPEASNAAAIAPALIEPPRFSHESGFYAEEFALSLSHPDENVTIYYTLDGSEPDPENLKGSTYRYKNSYQHIPASLGQPIPIKDDFLYQTYQTQKYEEPIPIIDRSYEPDRLAHIATDVSEQPDYFPTPEISNHWLNKPIHSANKAIVQVNRGTGNLNNVLNKAVRNFKRWRTGMDQPTGNIAFVMTIPELPYWEYTGRNLYKGTPVRAIAVKETPYRTTRSAIGTQVYFIGDAEQFDLPVMNITVPEPELYSYDKGVFVAGKGYEEWLADGVEEVIHSNHIPYEWNNGRVLKAHLNLFNTGQAQDVLIKTHGSASRRSRLKPLRIYPEPGVTQPGLFEDSAENTSKRFLLRNSGNDWDRLYFMDGVFQTLSEGLNFTTQRYQPYVLFINGEYYGILNARDRYDSKFIREKFDLPTADMDLLKTGFYAADSELAYGDNVAQHGSVEQWQKLIQKSVQKDVNDEMDINSFIDYHAAQIYLGNTDWPHNNLRVWRYKGTPVEGHPLTDGKWRWLMYDIDAVGGKGPNPEINILEHAVKGGSGENFTLFRELLSQPTFQQKFITRFADLLNTTYESKRVKQFINEAEQRLANEMPNHIARWSAPRNWSYWQRKVDETRHFAEKRPAIQRQHLQDYFGLGDLYTLDINVVLEDANGHQTPMDKGAIIRLNTLTLGVSDDELQKPVAASARATNMEKYLALPWSGEYFAGMPIELSVEPRTGYKFERWEGESLSRSQRDAPELELVPESDLSLKVVLSPLQ